MATHLQLPQKFCFLIFYRFGVYGYFDRILRSHQFELRSASRWCEQFLLSVRGIMSRQAEIDRGSTTLRQSSTSACHLCKLISAEWGPRSRELRWMAREEEEEDSLEIKTRPGTADLEGWLRRFTDSSHYLGERTRASLVAAEGPESVWHSEEARDWYSSCQLHIPNSFSINSCTEPMT